MTISIGTPWKDRAGRLCVVFDIYTTTSANGDIAETQYLSFFKELGERIEIRSGRETVLRGIARIMGESP